MSFVYWHVKPSATFAADRMVPDIAIDTSMNWPAEIETPVVEEHDVPFPLIEQLIAEFVSVKLLPVRMVNVSVTPVPGAVSTATKNLFVVHAVGTMDMTLALSVPPTTVGLVRLKKFVPDRSEAAVEVIEKMPGPVGPVAPVAPVAPVGPVGPCAPVAPVAPVAPAAPVAPVAPIEPVDPCCASSDHCVGEVSGWWLVFELTSEM